MNKKDILDLAQREKRDEGEDAMENKSRRIGSLAVIFLCLCLIILNNHFGRENDSLNAICTMAMVEFYVRFTFTKKINDLVLALIGTVFVILSLVAYVTAVVSGA